MQEYRVNMFWLTKSNVICLQLFIRLYTCAQAKFTTYMQIGVLKPVHGSKNT